MKVKTSSLTGKALEYCVIKLERPDLIYGEGFGIHHASDQLVIVAMKSPSCYSPYSSWEFCGPIIERCRVCLYVGHDGVWIACIRQNYDDVGEYMYGGETPLVAAMRCYVASKLGDVVDVPDELTVSS